MTETPPPSDAALRRDIRELGDVLGATITRQEGRAVFDLVERVRGLVRTDRAAAAALLAGVDPVTATKLVRAFTTFFHLANVAEQVDRARELQARRRATGGGRPGGGGGGGGRRLEELVELLWQTDELRIVAPDVSDEARNAVFYLDALHHDAVGQTLRGLVDELARAGVALPVGARPLTFGSWIGGDRDGNPNVTPDTTLAVLALQQDHAVRDALDVVDALRADLSTSVRITGVTPELEASLAEDLRRLPEVEDRYRRLNAEEPYRLKLTCVRARLVLTRRRLGEGAPHEPGRDYADAAELLG